jgi:hypothetical protein
VRSKLLLLAATCTALQPACAQNHFTDHKALYAYIAKAEGYAQPFSEISYPLPFSETKGIRLASLPSYWGEIYIQEDGVIANNKKLPFRKATDWPPSQAIGDFKIDLHLTAVFLDRSGRRMCLESSIGGNGGWARWRNIVVIEMKSTGLLGAHKWASMYASCNGLFVDGRKLIIGTLWHHHLSENSFTSMKLDLRRAWDGVLQDRYELSLGTPGNAFDLTATKN